MQCAAGGGGGGVGRSVGDCEDENHNNESDEVT